MTVVTAYPEFATIYVPGVFGLQQLKPASDHFSDLHLHPFLVNVAFIVRGEDGE